MRIKRDYLTYAYVGSLLILIVLLFTGTFASVTRTSLVVIQNSDPNSMTPTYFQGDIFVIYRADPEDIGIGDVVVFRKGDDRIIHRVIDIQTIDGDYYYRTKGDNPVENKLPDTYGTGFLIPYDAILGKTTLRIPYLGHLSLALQFDPVTQIVVYLSLGILLVVIIFWPEEEDEEEELDLSFASIKLAVLEWKSQLEREFMIFMTGKSRLLMLSVSLALLLLLLTPLFYPLLLFPPDSDYGIDKISVSHENRLTNNRLEINYFLQITVEFHDYTGGWNKISRIEIETYNNSVSAENLLAFSEWRSLRTMKGTFSFGGSAFIGEDHLVNGTNSLIIVAVMYVSTFMTEIAQPPISITYELEALL